MTVRVKFAKYGALKFIGHLDILRCFQKALRRSGLPVAYSKGYHPHQMTSFASPLSVGLTSDGEYMDLVLTEPVPTEEVETRLNAVLREGLWVHRVTALAPAVENVKKVTAMGAVTAADYLCLLNGCGDADKGSGEAAWLAEALAAFLSRTEIPVVVKTKTAEHELELKAQIFAHAATGTEFKTQLAALLGAAYVTDGSLHAPTAAAPVLYVQAAAGSSVNIKPELVLQAYFEAAEQAADEVERRRLSELRKRLCYHRMELYGEREGKRVPLWALD